MADNLDVRENGEQSPFSFLESPFSPIKQFTYKGKPWGRKFCLSSKDTFVFTEMMNEAYNIGTGGPVQYPVQEEVSKQSDSSGGLSINVCEKIRTKETLS